MRIDEFVNRRRTVPPGRVVHRRAADAAGAGRRHATAWIFHAFERIPEVMSNEFQQQASRRQPMAGTAGRELAPGFEIAEIRSKRSQHIVTHALAGEMLEGGDVVISAKGSKLIAPIEGQDSVQGVEFFGALECCVSGCLVYWPAGVRHFSSIPLQSSLVIWVFRAHRIGRHDPRLKRLALACQLPDSAARRSGAGELLGDTSFVPSV